MCLDRRRRWCLQTFRIVVLHFRLMMVVDRVIIDIIVGKTELERHVGGYRFGNFDFLCDALTS